MRGRGFVILIVLIVLAVAAYLLLRPGRTTFLRRSQPAEQLPLDLREIIPDDWTVLSDFQRQCNFDGDDDREWLIIYRYDQTLVNKPYTKEVQVERGPIGGAIFDTQNNVLPEDVGNPSPYPPTFVIPYRLLPDFYNGKGQGYLGETGVTVLYSPEAAANPADCKVDEITILGYADSPLPTRLSIFRWQDATTGYRGAHFAGDAWVDAEIPVTGAVSVKKVTTYNRLQNHRSLLCAVRTFNRTDGNSVTFVEELNVFSVDFCFGAPNDPIYPEGVVVAYVRGSKPTSRADAPPPPTNDYLLLTAQGTDNIRAGDTTRIFSLTNPATVNRDPAGGHACTSDEVAGGVNPEGTPGPTPTSLPAGGWICGRESATVETEIVLPGETQVRRVIWNLVSIIPGQVNGDTFWRIRSAELATTP